MRLATVTPDALPADLRAEYEQVRQGRLDLLAITEDDVLELHMACRALAAACSLCQTYQPP